MNSELMPWYRNFWPWFIIALLSCAILASLASAYLAVHTNDVVLDHGDQSS